MFRNVILKTLKYIDTQLRWFQSLYLHDKLLRGLTEIRIIFEVIVNFMMR